MAKEVGPDMLMGGDVDVISPVTLNPNWSITIRLVTIAALITVGTIVNGFYISSFFVVGSLRHAGYTFACMVGISDIIVSSLAVPMSFLVMLSGQKDLRWICCFQQFINTTACYSYSLFYLFLAIENYLRVTRRTSIYPFSKSRVVWISLTIIVVSVGFAMVGTYFGQDYDYCERKSIGNIEFRIASLTLFHAIPSLTTMSLLTLSLGKVKSRYRHNNHYRRSSQYDLDLCECLANYIAYILYLLHWIGFLSAIYNKKIETVSDEYFYYLAWLGVSRSVYTNLIFGFLNTKLRTGFAYNINYCCFRSSLAGPVTRRRRGVGRRAGNVRVPIMHQPQIRSLRATPPRDLQNVRWHPMAEMGVWREPRDLRRHNDHAHIRPPRLSLLNVERAHEQGLTVAQVHTYLSNSPNRNMETQC